MVRTADIATGDTRLVVDLHIPDYGGDSCGTSGQVEWSPDGTSLLVDYSDYSASDSPLVIRTVRVDGSADRTLLRLPRSFGFPQAGTARWLPDGHVMLAYWTGTAGFVVEQGDPMQPWPGTSKEFPLPESPHLFYPTISPDGDLVAIATMGESPPAGCSAAQACTGGVVVVDTADGSSRTVTNRISEGPLAFSPDGKQIAFVGYDSEVGYPATLVVAAADGSGEQVIAGVKGDNVAWSPDSQSVVVAGFAIDRVDLAHGTIQALVKRPNGPMLPSFAADWGPITVP